MRARNDDNCWRGDKRSNMGIYSGLKSPARSVFAFVFSEGGTTKENEGYFQSVFFARDYIDKIENGAYLFRLNY